VGNDGEFTTLRLTHFMSRFDHRMRRRFGIGLGVETVEGEAQRAGSIAGADPHGLKYM
jgi:hypothetical protein